MKRKSQLKNQTFAFFFCSFTLGIRVQKCPCQACLEREPPTELTRWQHLIYCYLLLKENLFTLDEYKRKKNIAFAG